MKSLNLCLKLKFEKIHFHQLLGFTFRISLHFEVSAEFANISTKLKIWFGLKPRFLKYQKRTNILSHNRELQTMADPYRERESGSGFATYTADF